MQFETPGPVEAELSAAIAPIEEIIEEARQGRMFILVDHEDRENEGDLVIPAQFADAQAINFMATHGRGLICLPMTQDRVDSLGLPMMAVNNSARHETAFTVSIEAREGVTTGISAADRALTVKVAINEDMGAADIATPGHVFPLRARDGGVLVRAGHTEAAVDISRLAGLHPSGVICEIMKDDGTMARLPDLVAFSEQHGLAISFTADARKRLSSLAGKSSLSVYDFCKAHFRDLHFGLKLISGNTGKTEFELDESSAKDPDTALSERVVASAAKEQELEMKPKNVPSAMGLGPSPPMVCFIRSRVTKTWIIEETR